MHTFCKLDVPLREYLIFDSESFSVFIKYISKSPIKSKLASALAPGLAPILKYVNYTFSDFSSFIGTISLKFIAIDLE